MTIACALIPKLPLLAAAGGRRELLSRPAALAPEPGEPQAVGDVTGAAEAFGVRAGMALSEALARCPELALIPPDADRAEALWEAVLRALEGIGAAVEPGRPGVAFFRVEGLCGLWGGSRERVLAQARRAAPRARLAAGATRLAAFSAARRARALRAPRVLGPAASMRLLAKLPVAVLHDALGWPAGEGRDWEGLSLPPALERLGIRTLGELASLPRDAVADRFGGPGLRAHGIARGVEDPLRPRPFPPGLEAEVELPEATSGAQLERALELLVDRLLASPSRAGRSLRRLRLGARLAGGGGFRAEVALREATARADRLRLALAPKLAELPGPAAKLSLRALATGPPASAQATLRRSPEDRRRERLAEAVRHARAVAGPGAVLRVLEVDPASRVPERRALLTPFTEPQRGPAP